MKKAYKRYLENKRNKKKLTIEEQLEFHVEKQISDIRDTFSYYSKEDLKIKESFEDSLIRLNISEDQLIHKHKAFKKRSKIYFYLLTIQFSVNAIYAYFSFYYAYMILLNIFLLCIFYQQRFYCYQIEKRELSNLFKFIKAYKFHLNIFKK
jgi:hypothetical protein